MGKGSQEDLLDGVRKSPLQTRLGNAGTEKGGRRNGKSFFVSSNICIPDNLWPATRQATNVAGHCGIEKPKKVALPGNGGDVLWIGE